MQPYPPNILYIATIRLQIRRYGVAVLSVYPIRPVESTTVAAGIAAPAAWASCRPDRHQSSTAMMKRRFHTRGLQLPRLS